MHLKKKHHLCASLIVRQKTICKRQYLLTKTVVKVCTGIAQEIKLVGSN